MGLGFKEGLLPFRVLWVALRDPIEGSIAGCLKVCIKVWGGWLYGAFFEERL